MKTLAKILTAALLLAAGPVAHSLARMYVAEPTLTSVMLAAWTCVGAVALWLSDK